MDRPRACRLLTKVSDSCCHLVLLALALVGLPFCARTTAHSPGTREPGSVPPAHSSRAPLGRGEVPPVGGAHAPAQPATASAGTVANASGQETATSESRLAGGDLADGLESLVLEHVGDGAAEYEGARQSMTGDLNGDGIEDLVALFTIEGWKGGNVYTRYLGVVLGGATGPQVRVAAVVGGKLRRSVELDRIEEGRVFLRTLSYVPGDPACCPSKAGRLECRLRARLLVCS